MAYEKEGVSSGSNNYTFGLSISNLLVYSDYANTLLLGSCSWDGSAHPSR